MNFSASFRILPTVTEAVMTALGDKDECEYIAKRQDGGIALRFNGIRIDAVKLELLFDGEAVAVMQLPELRSTDTLTVDMRESMVGQYDITITGA